jgi:hypothetical protein
MKNSSSHLWVDELFTLLILNYQICSIIASIQVSNTRASCLFVGTQYSSFSADILKLFLRSFCILSIMGFELGIVPNLGYPLSKTWRFYTRFHVLMSFAIIWWRETSSNMQNLLLFGISANKTFFSNDDDYDSSVSRICGFTEFFQDD